MATTTIRDAHIPSTPQKRTTEKTKRTFMLHSSTDMTPLGRFISTDWRYAALKAATRGHTQILLRQTGTREVKEFAGQRVDIEPKAIERGGRTITYNHRPQVKYVRSFVYTGAIDETAAVADNPRT